MAEITLVGWLHTILGILSIGSVIYTIAKHKIIKSTTKSGQIYLIDPNNRHLRTDHIPKWRLQYSPRPGSSHITSRGGGLARREKTNCRRTIPIPPGSQLLSHLPIPHDSSNYRWSETLAGQ